MSDPSPKSIQDLIELLRGTYALMGQRISDPALGMLVADLSVYPRESVIEALSRCRQECQTLTISAILDRMPSEHPTPEEAWALCAPTFHDEGVTVVRTDEMAQACGAAWTLRDDMIQTRQAFLEKYRALVAEARRLRRPPRWTVSLGTDPAGRVSVLRDAVAAGRLSKEAAERMIPPSHQAEFARVVDALARKMLMGEA